MSRRTIDAGLDCTLDLIVVIFNLGTDNYSHVEWHTSNFRIAQSNFEDEFLRSSPTWLWNMRPYNRVLNLSQEPSEDNRCGRKLVRMAIKSLDNNHHEREWLGRQACIYI